MLTSYHNHTRWSDGAEPVERLLSVARWLGFDELGISDHLVLDPDGVTPRWSLPPERLDDYLDAISSLRRDDAPRVLAGLELDWIPERAAELAAVVADPRLDYTIGSVHRIDGRHVDSVAEDLASEDPEAIKALFTRYWEQMRTLAESRLFQVVGHLDLPKKLIHGADLSDAPGREAALDAIAAAGMVVELNTAGWAMPCAEGYPSHRLLGACLNRGIPVTISGDAHRHEQLVAHFHDATRLLREVGYREVALLGEPELRFQPLAAFERSLAGT